MFKYAVTFSKTGTICYTSHLDLMRMFKRTFKRAGIKLAYSQGFNPHPKMGFAQPLSLGYIALKEFIEFETAEDYEPEFLKNTLSDLMPDGLGIIDCIRLEEGKKTLASHVIAAEYIIEIPISEPLGMTAEEIEHSYMGQDKITTMKRRKKKSPIEVDIKPMIQKLTFEVRDNALSITALLDSGSISNLSPELVISTLSEHLKLNVDRSEIEITRKEIYFQ